jgi:hypothetical protein
MEGTVAAIARACLAASPTPREMGQVLDRVGRWDECARRIAQRSGDLDYAQAFAQALRSADRGLHPRREAGESANRRA